MQQSRGIILHKKGTLVSLVDQHTGTIAASTFSSLVIGGLYTYNVKSSSFLPMLSEEKIFLFPLEVARYDILFFHHLLEITLYCVPIGSCISVFSLFLWVYTNEIAWNSKKGKLYTIFRLLVQVQMGPNEEIPKKLLPFAHIPIDRVTEETLKLIPEPLLYIWLKKSFLYHELHRKLKTNIMLKEIGLHV